MNFLNSKKFRFTTSILGMKRRIAAKVFFKNGAKRNLRLETKKIPNNFNDVCEMDF